MKLMLVASFLFFLALPIYGMNDPVNYARENTICHSYLAQQLDCGNYLLEKIKSLVDSIPLNVLSHNDKYYKKLAINLNHINAFYSKLQNYSHLDERSRHSKLSYLSNEYVKLM